MSMHPHQLAAGPYCYQHPDLQGLHSQKTEIQHGFFTAKGGVSSGSYASLNCGVGSDDDPALVRQNRRLVAASLGFQPQQMFGLRQTHSALVCTIDEHSDPSIEARAEADALVTKDANIMLAILTADCVPVLFTDPASGVIGAAHAGWRGAHGGVLDATITAMGALGASLGTIKAVIGPAIQQASYQVGDDLRAQLIASNAHAADFFIADSGPDSGSNFGPKFRFDLPGFVVWRLQMAGLQHIANLGVDTYGESAGLFSYRHASHTNIADTGRQISLIGRRVPDVSNGT